jgi:ATP-dependent helicase HrpA
MRTQALKSALSKHEARVARRRASVPRVSYPPALPISQKKDEILAAIRDHQVVIVAGETGSGKTTQLPKICLELGRGVEGLIGHTQPRRLAARTVAERIAEELGTPLGGAVGYQVRFSDETGEDTLVKLMTDGILLAEIQQDRLLRRYDTLIIDEAHERSLNVDFILGYLKRLLGGGRPDLKVIITSATIDPERFSRHFDDAPVIEVSGRTYPVEVRYRPIDEDANRDQTQAICEAVEELDAQRPGDVPGDVLVFLSGEREIRDTADALSRRSLRHTEILPLYARLSAAEQHRAFQPHTGRRIVLATNVAETSLTVPGIKCVVDPGTARISRYSHRTKVQRLPIERISQASADQRKGRCGRTSGGICIRLYSEEDFLSRPRFTDPEILRTNLASVILQMTALGLGDIAAFPFIDPPDRRNVKDGVLLLQELGAFDPASKDARKRLTPLGRKLAQVPVDPRLARMVLEADRNGCVREVLAIAAGLSIQDPRERPLDKQQAAAEKHSRFADKDSDFLAYLNLWQYLREKQRELSSSQFRKLCRTEFLNYLRVREWEDLYSQLRQVIRALGISMSSAPEDRDRIHMSLLAGLLSHIGLKDTERQEYQGARNARFAVSPGSALFKKSPQMVMAAELVETTRLWAHVVARVDPDWVEAVAQHLVKRNYSEPHWEKARGAVMAFERVTLYGVPIVASRKVNYGRIDPELARELFIRHALVEGDWETHHRFFHSNRKLLEEVEELEHRARRRDILVDDATLFDFYDQRVGREVVSARHFDSWWRRVGSSQPDLLSFERSMLVKQGREGVSAVDYPDAWRQGALKLRLSYQFEPGADADGVTVHIPLAILNQVTGEGFDWQVPGLRQELVTALIRSLPKPLRRNLVPVPDYAKAALERLSPGKGPLLDALGNELARIAAVEVPADAWQLDRVPDHLKITFRVVDDKRRTVAEDKDLERLRASLKGRMRAAVSAVADQVGLEREGLRTWSFGPLPRTHQQRQPRGGRVVKAYPALVDEGATVAVRLLESEAEQQRAMWQGTRRLLLLNVPSPVKSVLGRLPKRAKLTLSQYRHGSAAELFDDCVACAVDALIAECGGPAWDQEGFDKLLDKARGELNGTVLDVVTKVEPILAAAQDVEQRLRSGTSPALAPARERQSSTRGARLEHSLSSQAIEAPHRYSTAALADVSAQLSELVYPGFVSATGWRRLPDLLRYVRAMQHRLDKLPGHPQRDQELMADIGELRQSYQHLLDRLPPGTPPGEALREVRWMIEELWVSYFAQTLGTPYPVSAKRIRRAMDQLKGKAQASTDVGGARSPHGPPRAPVP